MKSELCEISKNNPIITFNTIFEEPNIIKAQELFQASQLDINELNELLLFINTFIQIKMVVTPTSQEHDLIALYSFFKLVSEKYNLQSLNNLPNVIPGINLTFIQNNNTNVSFNETDINDNQFTVNNFRPDISPSNTKLSEKLTQLLHN